MSNNTKFEITTSTIVKIVLAVFLVWFIYAIRDIVFLFFIVLVIVAALSPLVDKLSKYIPRTLSVILLSFILLAFFVGIGFLILPPLISQLSQLSINLPAYLEKFGPIYQNLQSQVANYQDSLFSVSSQLSRLTSGIYSTTIGFISGIVGVFTVLVLSFYMLLEKNVIWGFLHQSIPMEHKEKVITVYRKIANKMGSWLRGQVMLMIIIGLCEGIALSFLGVPYVLVLAVWGGMTEVIPYIGPWLGLIPAAIIAFTISPIKGLLVILIYIVIQQLESQFLAPKIMGKAVGLSPVIIILSLLIGAKLEGILGVLVAVPVAAIISVIIQEWPELRKIKLNS